MGGLNAVDIANETHWQILAGKGLMRKEDVLLYGDALPVSDVLEGLYIDDHIVMAIVPKSELSSSFGRDKDIIDASHEAYREAKLPRAPEKGFGFARNAAESSPTGDTNFLAWGSEVKNEPGTVGTPESKRATLLALTCCVLGFRKVSLGVLERLLGLYVHPWAIGKNSCVFGIVHTNGSAL